MIRTKRRRKLNAKASFNIILIFIFYNTSILWFHLFMVVPAVLTETIECTTFTYYSFKLHSALNVYGCRKMMPRVVEHGYFLAPFHVDERLNMKYSLILHRVGHDILYCRNKRIAGYSKTGPIKCDFWMTWYRLSIRGIENMPSQGQKNLQTFQTLLARLMIHQSEL